MLITKHLCLLSMCGSLLAATGLSNASTFVLEKKGTNFSIDGNKGGVQGQQVYLFGTNTNNANQRWIQIERDGGFYSYQKENTNMCLDGGNGGTRGQAVILYVCSESNRNQHWRKVVVSSTDATYRLEKRNAPGFSIDGNLGSAQLQPIYLWDSNNNNVNQQWRFINTDTAVSITREEAVRFLVQGAYGPTEDSIEDVQSLNYEGWVAKQMSIAPVYWLDRIDSINAQQTAYRYHLSGLFWEGAVEGEDQLRQRVVFALSQIIANNNQADLYHVRPEIFGHYWDIFQTHAFGNYEDLLYDISVSPAMGLFLTHLNNEKENLDEGTAPDENFAREIMQLFSIGLVDLDRSGNSTGVESYTTNDVQQLARVFTGFSWDDSGFGGELSSDDKALASPMRGFYSFHDFGNKTFLGETVSGSGSPQESVAEAISILINHPNTAPFISKQFIQKLVTANPPDGYVRRVESAFRTGRFVTPSGAVIGTGRRGDMAAMISAVLLDPSARSAFAGNDPSFGKVRGPVLRQAQWARTFRDSAGRDLNGVPPEFLGGDWKDNNMGQTPLRPPSVFGFYRPGYVMPDSETSNAGLVNPEMQVVTASTAYGYLRYMSELITGPHSSWLSFFNPDYTRPIALANNPAALADYLNEIMVYGSLTDEVYGRVVSGIQATPVTGLTGANLQEALRERVHIAMMIIVASPEYITQR